MVTRMARIPALTPAAEQSTTDGPTTLMVKQRQEVAEQLSEAFSSEAATDFVSWCTRREASTGLGAFCIPSAGGKGSLTKRMPCCAAFSARLFRLCL